MENEHDDTSCLRTRRKTSSSLSCCFINSHRRSDLLIESSPSPSRFSSCWFRNKIKHDHNSPEIRGKCKSFIHRMGRPRRHVSADFSYDPLSYAMNFDDDDEPYEEFPARNFAARLPLSPPSKDKIPITNMQSKSFKLSDQRSRAIQDVRRSLEMPIAQVNNAILTEDAKNTF
ncbi:hypothetical protein KY290_026115 [Solanum tuberosum]|uniref:Uncharacterized protein n=1 Tax=Solanum tuberosum TaxID=4113 RepID=A0ABQ7UYK3_SOLTU|nr:hypothetical protein KY289_025211 [Solanum tuberosum]KAH0673887.1 hypothetical protein KY284_024974 [Solanum tuberosum]KAH0755845.1 hypothetical protein KY290_026115 [Solanum tuberosum]